MVGQSSMSSLAIIQAGTAENQGSGKSRLAPPLCSARAARALGDGGLRFQFQGYGLRRSVLEISTNSRLVRLAQCMSLTSAAGN